MTIDISPISPQQRQIAVGRVRHLREEAEKLIRLRDAVNDEVNQIYGKRGYGCFLGEIQGGELQIMKDFELAEGRPEVLDRMWQLGEWERQ